MIENILDNNNYYLYINYFLLFNFILLIIFEYNS